MIDSTELEKLGHMAIRFENRTWLDEIQKTVREHFLGDPTMWHKNAEASQLDHLQLAKQINAAIVQGDFVKKLLADNLVPFREIVGPNLDIQVAPHLRISRPEKEEDLVDWHRDSFYGNSPWEMNLWFPLFTLEEGAGLLFVEGSHLTPSRNIRVVKDANEFRRAVTKGSVANDMGYVYLPKTDDTISNMNPTHVRCLSPDVGSGVFFFGCGIHRAQNLSNRTRISLDVRIRDARAPTETKSGYYRPLCRSVVESCVAEFLGNTTSN